MIRRNDEAGRVLGASATRFRAPFSNPKVHLKAGAQKVGGEAGPQRFSGKWRPACRFALKGCSASIVIIFCRWHVMGLKETSSSFSSPFLFFSSSLSLVFIRGAVCDDIYLYIEGRRREYVWPRWCHIVGHISLSYFSLPSPWLIFIR